MTCTRPCFFPPIFLFQRGASLVLTGRNRENLEKVASECDGAGGQPLTIIANLDREKEVESIVDGEFRFQYKFG